PLRCTSPQAALPASRLLCKRACYRRLASGRNLIPGRCPASTTASSPGSIPKSRESSLYPRPEATQTGHHTSRWIEFCIRACPFQLASITKLAAAHRQDLLLYLRRPQTSRSSPMRDPVVVCGLGKPDHRPFHIL